MNQIAEIAFFADRGHRAPPPAQRGTPALPSSSLRANLELGVFIRVNQVVDGWEDLPVTFSGIVPAAA